MCLVLNSSLENLPAAFERMLEEFKDLFQEMPKGLPPIRGIEHQIDFVFNSLLLNCLAYRSNLEESKEIQRQVKESKSQCVVTVILVPDK
ncbi:hypothetical protein CR513_45440, partial [Mucuna pruriens]